MHSKLVEDTIKENIIQEDLRFETTIETQMWSCPFCNLNTTPYKVYVPSCTQVYKWKQSTLLIKTHIELHKKDILSQMSSRNELTQYEKARAESSKRVRLWITGTINDRRLYEEDPL